MELLAAAFIVATVKKLVDFVRTASAKAWREAFTLLIAWVSAVLLTFLVAASDFANTLQANGLDLGQMNRWSLVIVGISLGSAAAVGNDVLAAIDSSRSSYVPPLAMKPGIMGGAGGS